MDMKKTLTTALLIFGILTFSQGRRANQNAVQTSYGIMPDVDNTEQNSFMVKAGYSKVIGKKGFLGKTEIFYQKYGVGYIDLQTLPYQKIGISAQAGWSLENLSPFFVNFYLGGFGAHETINGGENKETLYQSEIPEKTKGITYGIAGGLEAEIIVYRNISFTVDYNQYYDLKSKFSETSYGLFGGLKIYLN